MSESDKAKITRLESENRFLKEIIRTQYKKALEALNFVNKGNISKIDNDKNTESTFKSEF